MSYSNTDRYDYLGTCCANVVDRYRFDENIKIREDICFWIAVVKTFIILGIDEALTEVRILKISTSQNMVKQVEGYFAIIVYVYFAATTDPDVRFEVAKLVQRIANL